MKSKLSLTILSVLFLSVFATGCMTGPEFSELGTKQSASTHYTFVKFEANGAVVTGNTDLTKNVNEEWIQCEGVTFGHRRDISGGGRVGGHTSYDRVTFSCSAASSDLLLPAVQLAAVADTSVVFNQSRTDKYLEVFVKGKRLGGIILVDGDAAASLTGLNITVDLTKALGAESLDNWAQ